MWAIPFGLGAGDGSRTRDVQLGRLELYQLSYSRELLLLLCDFIAVTVQSLIVLKGACARWRGKDSNLRSQRRQIYSLFPLATREPLRVTVTRSPPRWIAEFVSFHAPC